MISPVLLAMILGQSGQTRDVTAEMYSHACNTGMVVAQRVLPQVSEEQRAEFLRRGYDSCRGSLSRMQKSGELAQQKEVAAFACGYAVGAMFAKYGINNEVSPPSKRVKQAMETCLVEVERQFAVLPSELATQGAKADGPPWKTIFWNISFDGGGQVCLPLERKSEDLRGIFAARRGHECPGTDEGDHLLYKCGQVKEVAIFSREQCLSWVKAKLTASETRRMVAFSGCFKTARQSLGVDAAIPYCNCTASQIGKYSEGEISKWPKTKIEAIGRDCLGTTSAKVTPAE
ncbi:MAG: hypothetical protein WBP56_17920 [Polyangia bacterium]